MTFRFAVGAVAGAAVLTVLTACGSSTSASPQVASLPSVGDSASAGATTSASAATGVQERLDDSSARNGELLNAYFSCLHDHGAPSFSIGGHGWKVDPDKATAAELQACASKKPIPPPELDPTKNAHYAQDVQADAQCARDHGISFTIGPDGWWVPTDPNQPNLGTVERQCLLQAFGNN